MNIQEVMVQTMISVSSIVTNNPNAFEVYGFDIMLDDTLKAWLIEVNASPSMTAATPSDHKMKVGLLDDLFTIIDLEMM